MNQTEDLQRLYPLNAWPHHAYPRRAAAFIDLIRRFDARSMHNFRAQDILAPSLLPPGMLAEVESAPASRRASLSARTEPVSGILDKLTSRRWYSEMTGDSLLPAITFSLLQWLRIRLVSIDADTSHRLPMIQLVGRLIQFLAAGVDPLDAYGLERAVFFQRRLPPPWAQPRSRIELFPRCGHRAALNFMRDYRIFQSSAPWSDPAAKTGGGLAASRVNKSPRGDDPACVFDLSGTGHYEPYLSRLHPSNLRIESFDGRSLPTPRRTRSVLRRTAQCQALLAPPVDFVPDALNLLRFVDRHASKTDDQTHLHLTTGVLAVLLGIPVREVLLLSTAPEITDSPLFGSINPGANAVSLHVSSTNRPHLPQDLPPQQIILPLPLWAGPHLKRASKTTRSLGVATLEAAVLKPRFAECRGSDAIGIVGETLAQACSGLQHRPTGFPFHDVLHLAWLYTAICLQHLDPGVVQLAVARPVGFWRTILHYFRCSSQHLASAALSIHWQLLRLADVPSDFPFESHKVSGCAIGQGPIRPNEIAKSLRDSIGAARRGDERAAASSIILELAGGRPTRYQPHPSKHVLRVGDQSFAIFREGNSPSSSLLRPVPIPNIIGDAARACGAGEP